VSRSSDKMAAEEERRSLLVALLSFYPRKPDLQILLMRYCTQSSATEHKGAIGSLECAQRCTYYCATGEQKDCGAVERYTASTGTTSRTNANISYVSLMQARGSKFKIAASRLRRE
jgi:hypothetical protein